MPLSPQGSLPTARHYHTTVYSEVADAMYLFGGHSQSLGVDFNDLHKYDRQANR